MHVALGAPKLSPSKYSHGPRLPSFSVPMETGSLTWHRDATLQVLAEAKEAFSRILISWKINPTDLIVSEGLDLKPLTPPTLQKDLN